MKLRITQTPKGQEVSWIPFGVQSRGILKDMGEEGLPGLGSGKFQNDGSRAVAVWEALKVLVIDSMIDGCMAMWVYYCR